MYKFKEFKSKCWILIKEKALNMHVFPLLLAGLYIFIGASLNRSKSVFQLLLWIYLWPLLLIGVLINKIINN